MMTRICSGIAIIYMGACSAVHAAQYEFTLQGQVASSAYQDVAAGDPFTIRFVADASDQDPDPTRGEYDASRAIVILPNRSITAIGSQPHVFVNLNSLNMTQSVRYSSFVPNYLFTIDFAFPAGTLASDELPLSLPMPLATTAYMNVYFFATEIAGSVTNYASAEIPEPPLALLLLPVTVLILLVRNRVAIR